MEGRVKLRIELKIFYSDTILNYRLSQKLKLLGDGEFNHLTISLTILIEGAFLTFPDFPGCFYNGEIEGKDKIIFLDFLTSLDVFIIEEQRGRSRLYLDFLTFSGVFIIEGEEKIIFGFSHFPIMFL